MELFYWGVRRNLLKIRLWIKERGREGSSCAVFPGGDDGNDGVDWNDLPGGRGMGHRFRWPFDVSRRQKDRLP